jgi:hypothetical protein
MVTFLVARVPAGPASVAAELVLGPASELFRRQLDALGAVAEAGATAVRAGADQLGPGVTGALVASVAVAVVSFLVAGLATFAWPAGIRPRRRPAPAAAAS